MQKTETPARLKELGMTARAEFDRFLMAGLCALDHLPFQHKETVKELLTRFDLSLDDARKVQAEFSASRNIFRNDLDARVKYTCTDRRLGGLSNQAVATLILAHLILVLEEQPSFLRDAPLIGQMRFYQEVLRHWWIALVIPELHSAGIQGVQSKRRRNSNSTAGAIPVPISQQYDWAKKRRSMGVERSEAVELFMKEFSVQRSRANKVFRAIGWLARRPRKPA